MAQIIKHRRSPTTAVPANSSLATAELAYTEVGGVKRLFIGQLDGVNVKEIAGDSYALLASPAFTGTPTAPTASAGTSTTQIATTAFVSAAVSASLDGITYKAPVRVASVANVVIATALEDGDVVDGITLATGDRVLLKDQSTASENGIYVVVASGAASRATDFDANAEVKAGATMFVDEGTVNADRRYTLSTNNPIVVGTTALVFVNTSGAALIAGDGIDIASNVISVDVTDLVGSGLESDGSNNIRIAAAAAGNGLTGGAGSALSVVSDATGGANLSRSINVSANGVAVKVDAVSIIEGASNRLEVGTVDGGTF